MRDGVVPGIVLGIGLGSMIDLIVFHLILQWHHVASARVLTDTLDGLRLNVLLDGVLLGAMWILTVVALALLWRAAGAPADRPPGSRVVGAALVGWGGFNVYDGIVDHYVFQLHHTTHGADAALWDAVIVAWGVAFMAVGWLVVRRTRARTSELGADRQ